jgi:3',5'-cyclic AMP phosphodiesterase CpdA
VRIALLSDTHVSARAPECVANWYAARRAVERLRPDLTVHLGDITLDGQSQPDEIPFAAALATGWPTHLRFVPGNHDVGAGCGEAPVDESLYERYQHFFGSDRWIVGAGDWQLVGINAQLLGSDSPREDEQWRWLEGAAIASSARSTVLFLHRPLLRTVASDPKIVGRYVPVAAARRLLEGPLRRTLRLVVSGHTHQYLDADAAGVRHLWMPSSAFILPDRLQSRVGEKVVGIGVLGLVAGDVRFELFCPDGMQQHDVSRMKAYESLAGEAPRERITDLG